MADKVICDKEDLVAIADALRSKLKVSTTYKVANLGSAVGSIGTINGTDTSDINFYDYDGTLLYSYTLEELQELTSLPVLPSHEGLICQGWNWTLEQIKAENSKVNVGAMYITDDGTTRIYIHLEEGRTSPMLGLAVNGTVTVDWGDGSTSTLTGTSTSTAVFTDNHNYANAGDYVIKLTVTGSAIFTGAYGLPRILCYRSSDDGRNGVYRNAIQKVEIGSNISIGSNAFFNCYSLLSITIPFGITSIGEYAFTNCYSLTSIIISSGVTSIGITAFNGCKFRSISIPLGIKRLNTSVFSSCVSLKSIPIPSSITGPISESAFNTCHSLTSIRIPQGVTGINKHAFINCYSLRNINIPSSVIYIGQGAFQSCVSLTRMTIPAGVKKIIDSSFYNCSGVKYYDFSNYTSVPTLSHTSAFKGISPDCEIRVPSALVDEWKAATNWSAYADYIVGV